MSDDCIKILITDEDKLGNDITKMSDFFEEHINYLSSNLVSNSPLEILESIPVVDIGIMMEAIHGFKSLLEVDSNYILDFSSLPKDIYDKLKAGIYKLGQSKQVAGNVRPVILDENNVRIKDLTIKRVINNTNNVDLIKNMFDQLQMRQIYMQLTTIQDMQCYQIESDRGQTLLKPFLSARDYILRAQDTNSYEESKRYLRKADEKLIETINAVYLDIDITSRNFIKATKNSIFKQIKTIDEMIKYIVEDIQFMTKYVGIQIQVLNYLGDSVAIDNTLKRYKRKLLNMFSKEINGKKQSLIHIMHDYYPYSEENMNCWLEFENDVVPKLQLGTKSKDVLLLSVKEKCDEKKRRM